MEPHYNDEMKIMTFFKWHSIEVYLFSPVWQLQSGVIQNHYFHMSKRVLLKCRAQILHNEVSLHFWCPAHSLKWEVCEEPIGGLVLPGYAPDRNTFLSISFQKPEKVVIIYLSIFLSSILLILKSVIKFSFTLEMMLFTINNVYFSRILKKILSNGWVFISLSVYEAIIYN